MARRNRTFRFVKLCGVAFAGVAAFGCASTSFISSWKAPVEGPIEFDNKRVAAVVVSADETTRRVGETELARRISARGRAQGIASYTLISGEEAKDKEGAKKKLQDAKIEGAVVMRVVSSEQEISYSPGTSWYAPYPYYGSFYGYWGYGWPVAYDPGYLRTDRVVMVETLIYSVTQDKLLWAGKSKTTNPENIQKFVKEVADGAAKEMRKAGFIN
ncbi:MAG TPA: hypothetical protein VIE88_04890 [Vicinamibacteria bacterium]